MGTQCSFLTVLSLTLAAGAAPVHAVDVLLEAKAAYFRPSDNKFRKIYSSRGIYGVESSVQAWRELYGWASGSYYSSWGHSIWLKNRTHVCFVPLALGLKYIFNFEKVDVYAGAGAMGTYLHIRDYSHYVTPRSSKWGFGGVAKAGAIVDLPHSFFLDFFSDYSYMKIQFHNTDRHRVQSHPVDLSGWSIGGAIGYRFG